MTSCEDLDTPSPHELEVIANVKLGQNVCLTGSYDAAFWRRLSLGVLGERRNIWMTTLDDSAVVPNILVPFKTFAGFDHSNVPSVTDELPVDDRLNWSSCNILCIHQVSLMSPQDFESIDWLAKNIRKSDKPFGGLQLVVSMIPGPSSVCISESPLWGKLFV